MQADKPVFSICHASQILIITWGLEGRRITGWKSIFQDIINAAAEYIDREEAIDGNLVSSRSLTDLPAYVKASLIKQASAS